MTSKHSHTGAFLSLRVPVQRSMFITDGSALMAMSITDGTCESATTPTYSPSGQQWVLRCRV